MRVKFLSVPPNAIHPPHRVDQPDLFTQLMADMAQKGWSGRPLLAVEYGAGYVALTGSHRLAAAKAAALDEVPILTLIEEEGDVLPDPYAPDWGLPLDDDLPLALDEIGAPHEAVALAAEEEVV